MEESKVVQRTRKINYYVFIDVHFSYNLEGFKGIKRIADFLSPEGKVNRFYFLGLERAYAVQELLDKLLSKDLEKRLSEKGWIFYENILPEKKDFI